MKVLPVPVKTESEYCPKGTHKYSPHKWISVVKGDMDRKTQSQEVTRTCACGESQKSRLYWGLTPMFNIPVSRG